MIRIFCLAVIILFAGCSKIVEEYDVLEIPLSGRVSERNSELSGLAWFGEDLVLLVQYPGVSKINQKGVIYKISKEKILDYINGKELNPLNADSIFIEYSGLGETINSKGSGCEAILFDKNRVYLSVEKSEKIER